MDTAGYAHNTSGYAREFQSHYTPPLHTAAFRDP